MLDQTCLFFVAKLFDTYFSYLSWASIPFLVLTIFTFFTINILPVVFASLTFSTSLSFQNAPTYEFRCYFSCSAVMWHRV